MRQRRYLWAALAALWLSSAAPASAQPVDDAARAKARSLGYAGVEAFAAGDYRDASAKLEESYQLLPVPSLGLWSARTLVKLGKLVEAEERYRAVASLTVNPSDPAAQQSAKEDAAREHGELLPRIPSLKIRLVGAEMDEVSVTVDEVVRQANELAVALLLNPGRHTVAGRRASEHTNFILHLAEGAHEEVELRFSPPALRAPEPGAAATVPLITAPPAQDERLAQRRMLRTGAWIALGAGAAGLGMGVVSYFMASDQYESFQRRDGCVNGGCSQQEVDTYGTLRTLYLVSVISGGVLAAAGTTVLVISWPAADELDSESPGVSLRVGPGAASLVGVF